MGKKIISFSLWGDTAMYTSGAMQNAVQCANVYPGWICRFYIGDDVPEHIVDNLERHENTEVVKMFEEENDWQGMFWRFYPIGEEDVDLVVFRDTDSRPSFREKEAVDEWISSGKILHIMRDHPYHSEPIMGGMWGCKPKELLSILNSKVYQENGSPIKTSFKEVIDNWLIAEEKLRPSFTLENREKGIDQQFLRKVVYELLYPEAWIHDSYPQYNCYSGRFDYQRHPRVKEMNTGFPTKRGTDWNNFVGQVYDENNVPNADYAKLMEERDKKIYEDHGVGS